MEKVKKDLEVGIVLETFDVPTMTVFDVIHQVSHSIMAVYKRAVRLPATNELEVIDEGVPSVKWPEQVPCK